MHKDASFNKYFSGRDTTVAVSYLVNLKQFDMVYVEKVKDGWGDHTSGNKHFFEGRLIP